MFSRFRGVFKVLRKPRGRARGHRHLSNRESRAHDISTGPWLPGPLQGALQDPEVLPSVTTAHCCHMFRRSCSYRPTDDSNQPPGRGVLSMHGLTYGVIRVDSEEKLSVLTVQDVGLVMPGGECGPQC